jgi:hypothetical protein
VARSELNLTGTKTARFTVATFLNTGVWNNDGDGTAYIAENTADAVDSMAIPPWGTPDNAANLSSWLEDISDADIDFWVDVGFAAGGVGQCQALDAGAGDADQHGGGHGQSEPELAEGDRF